MRTFWTVCINCKPTFKKNNKHIFIPIFDDKRPYIFVTLFYVKMCTSLIGSKKTAHMFTHRTGHVHTKYHDGVLVAFTTGACCCWSRANHVSNIPLSWNLLRKNLNDVLLVAELTLPNLQQKHV